MLLLATYSVLSMAVMPDSVNGALQCCPNSFTCMSTHNAMLEVHVPIKLTKSLLLDRVVKLTQMNYKLSIFQRFVT